MVQPRSSPGSELVVCNRCLVLVDPEWEPVVRIGEFNFHTACAPACSVCGRPLRPGQLSAGRAGGAGGADRQAATFVVLESQTEFVSARGYQVRLKVCCCPECYDGSLHDEPPALA